MAEQDAFTRLREFPVDLDRAEFVRYNMYMARERGLYRFRGVMLTAFGLIFAAAAASVISALIRHRPLDTAPLTLMFFVLLCGMLMLFGVPNYIRIKAGSAYDRSLMAGQEYYGLIRLYGNRIEKTVGTKTVSIPFAQAGYAEYEDMIVIVSPDTPAIILPARCVTTEDAAAVREAALAVVAENARRRYAVMVSRTAVRLAVPAAEADDETDETLLVIPVSYTPDEFLHVVTRSAMNVYFSRLPICAGVSFIAALALAFSRGPYVMSLIFLGGMLLFFIIHVVIPRVRTQLRLPGLTGDALVMHMFFSKKGIRITGTGRHSLFYPWLAVTRVARRGQWFDFSFTRDHVEVPEHCIADPAALKDLLNTYLRRDGADPSANGYGGGSDD